MRNAIFLNIVEKSAKNTEIVFRMVPQIFFSVSAFFNYISGGGIAPQGKDLPPK